MSTDLRAERLGSLSFSESIVSPYSPTTDDLRCHKLRVIYSMLSSCINDCVCTDNIVTGRAHVKQVSYVRKRKIYCSFALKHGTMTKQKSILDPSNFSRTFATRRDRRKVCHSRNEISIRDLVNLGSG